MPENKTIFCSSCGKPIAEGMKFCTNCGAPARNVQPQQYNQPVPQQYSQPVPQQYSQPVPQSQYGAPVPAYAGAPAYAQPPRVKKRKPHGCLVSIIALLLVAVIIYTGFFWPAFIPRIVRHFTPMPDYCNNGFSDSAKVTGSSSSKVGSIDESGLELNIGKDAFDDGTTVSVEALPTSDISGYEHEGYEILGSVISVNADNYDGKFFADDVVLKIKLPVSQMDWSSNNGDYFVEYFDESKNNRKIVEPDTIDIKKGIAEIRLMALETGKAISSKTAFDERSSGLRRMTAAANGELNFLRADNGKKGRAELAFVKPDEKKKVDKYLNDWCTTKAHEDTLSEDGKEAFQPYVKAIAEKMAATKEARDALAEAMLGKLISGIDTSNKTGKLVSGSLDFTNTLGWGAYRAVKNGETLEFGNALGTAASKALASALADGEYTNYVGAAGSIGTMAGQIDGGDYVGAVQTAEEAALGFFPTANMIDKAAKYVVRKVDMDYTMWKKDRIDDLYVKWRDGFETHPGYIFSVEYKARDFDDLMMYLDYDTHSNKSGFGNADMMLKRIYDSDQKINEQVKRYGFGSRTYNELSNDEKNQFANRVTNGLKEYFEQRYKNETRTAKLLKDETDFVNELYEYGFFDSSRRTKVFLDENAYDTEGRLNMIYKIREMIGKWVDPKKQKEQSFNNCYLVSQYADFRQDSSSTKEAKDKMLRWLKENKLLKAGIEVPEDDKVTVDDIAGTWNLNVSFTNIESIAIDWLTQFFKTLVEAFVDDPGEADTKIQSFKESFKNGVNDVTQIMKITKLSENRVKVELTTPDSETSAFYEGTLDDKGVLSITLKSSTYSDGAISFDIKDLQYKFYKNRGYITCEGTYDIRTIVFSATYTYAGEKNLRS